MKFAYAPTAAQQSCQYTGSLRRRTSRHRPLYLRVLGQQPLVALVVFPTDITLVMIAQQPTPSLALSAQPSDRMSPSVDHARLSFSSSEGVRARIDWVLDPPDRDGPTRLRGDVVLLEDQDRALWNRAQIAEGLALADAVLRAVPPVAHALKAAIVVEHAKASRVHPGTRLLSPPRMEADAPAWAARLCRERAVLFRDGSALCGELYGRLAPAELGNDARSLHHSPPPRRLSRRGHQTQRVGYYSLSTGSFVCSSALRSSDSQRKLRYRRIGVGRSIPTMIRGYPRYHDSLPRFNGAAL